MLFFLFSVKMIQKSVRCTVYGVRCMVYGVRCTVYGVWCMVYGVGFSLKVKNYQKLTNNSADAIIYIKPKKLKKSLND